MTDNLIKEAREILKAFTDEALALKEWQECKLCTGGNEYTHYYVCDEHKGFMGGTTSLSPTHRTNLVAVISRLVEELESRKARERKLEEALKQIRFTVDKDNLPDLNIHTRTFIEATIKQALLGESNG